MKSTAIANARIEYTVIIMAESGVSKPVVLVTGVSSGIGLALARKLWETDYRVIATARAQSLGKLANEPFENNERFQIRQLDVTIHEERERIVREAQELWGGIDILVNNAGISYRAVIEHMSEDDDRLQLRTNFLAPMALTRLVLPEMRRRKSGHIINVSSVGGMMAMPTMGAYSASKFALEGASEALWYEMRPWKVSVTLVQPGFVHSKSFQNVYWSERAQQSVDKNGGYAPYYERMGAFVERFMNMAIATPESIADKILSVMASRNPPLWLPATIDAHVFSALRRVLPRRMYHWVLYRNLPGVRTWGKYEQD